ncbi:PQQ-binding-like beta-propeller repeat protein [Streptomyces phaeochromogenes]|uniref:outer membrane protein assembly factor BamB family protein n=1 Tax=Streptomyces phaeochromogenes TaxID=1923 RepID=UPI003689007F
MQVLRGDDPSRMGDFKLLAVLGAGGMATVYLADMKRCAADPILAVVKVLRREWSQDEYVRRLFRREIEALSEMNAQGTLKLLDSDPDSASPWFATEYVPGMDLRTLVSDHGPLATRAVLRLAAEIAPILMRLQNYNIVHRDLKPSNILILSAADGSLRLIDFGVARRLDRTRTKPTMKVGTDAFMAPEQMFGGAGHPSDMFALGLTLAFAATGRERDRPDLTEALLSRAPRFPEDAFDDLGKPLREVVKACTRPDPAHRMTAEELLTRLAHHGVRTRENRTNRATWLPNTARTRVLKHAEHTRGFMPEQRTRQRASTRPVTRADGPEVSWTHRLSGRAWYTSPIDVAEGIAVCSLDGSVQLLDSMDGTVLWQRDLGGRIENTPATGHGMLFVPCSDRTLLALDINDGSLRWSYRAGDSCLFAPVVHGERVLVGARDGGVHCLSAHTGKAHWVSRRGNGPVFDRPTVAADRVYVSGWQGHLEALRLDDGSSTTRLPQVKDIVGAPTAQEDRLFLASRTGALCAVETETGLQAWCLAGRTAACTGPVMGHDMLYLGTVGGTVWAHDTHTGSRVWRHSTSRRIKCAPVHDNDTLYVGSGHTLTALDALEGRLHWTHRTGASMHAPPLLAHGHAYVATWDCAVQALRLPSPALR